MPDFSFELAAMAQGATRIAGVDEVGRGPLAGPVLAAAVVLNPDAIPAGLADSKKLTARRRDALAPLIRQNADWGIGIVDVAEIDRINILQASLRAMELAIAALGTPPDFALIDGNRVPPGLTCPAQEVVKGDDRSASIAAASILAKVSRDAIMRDLAARFPGYGWETNAGYGTKAHLAALDRLGVTPEHRVSFKPIHNILYQEKK